MWLLPFDQFSIQTNLQHDEVLEKLKSVIEKPSGPLKGQFFTTKKFVQEKPYAGTLRRSKFNVTRKISYRNSWNPTIAGKFEAHPQGIRIKFTLSIHPLVAIFMFVWLGMATFALVSAIKTASANGDFDVIAIPLVMVLLGYGLTMGAYKVEYRKSKRFFQKLFGGVEL